MNARACFANFINERFMPGPLENADDELVNADGLSTHGIYG